MTKKQTIQLFEGKKVRTVWDDEQEKWYFSIVDVCGVLTDSKDPTAYWRKLKQRLKEEGNETVTKRSWGQIDCLGKSMTYDLDLGIFFPEETL